MRRDVRLNSQKRKDMVIKTRDTDGISRKKKKKKKREKSEKVKRKVKKKKEDKKEQKRLCALFSKKWKKGP
jgi:hypothetical protein